MWVMTMMTAVLVTASPVALQYDGSLKEGLKQLAQKSGLNLVVIGDLDEKVQLDLPGVDGEEALETIAQAYGLEVTRSGKGAKVWVIRKAGGTAAPSVALVAPVAVVSAKGSAESMREAADQARAAADQARAEVDVVREKTESLKNVSAEAREKAQEAMETAREKAQEASDDAREKEQEAAESAALVLVDQDDTVLLALVYRP